MVDGVEALSRSSVRGFEMRGELFRALLGCLRGRSNWLVTDIKVPRSWMAWVVLDLQHRPPLRKDGRMVAISGYR